MGVDGFTSGASFAEPSPAGEAPPSPFGEPSPDDAQGAAGGQDREPPVCAGGLYQPVVLDDAADGDGASFN